MIYINVELCFQTIARMAKELSKEVGVEVVDLVAEVTGQMGPDLTRNEIHLMTQMAKNADSDIKEKDVQILSDIAKVIGPQPAPEVVSFHFASNRESNPQPYSLVLSNILSFRF